MEEYLLIFLVSFIGTFVTYFALFFKSELKKGRISIFIKGNLILSTIIALVIVVILKLISIELQFTTVLVFVVIGVMENNIFIPVVLGEVDSSNKVRETIIATVTSKVLVFVVLYLVIF